MFLISLFMKVVCGDYTFMSSRKDSPFVQVLTGISNLKTIKRTQAEGLFKHLRKQGFQPKVVSGAPASLNGAIPTRWV